MTNGCFDIIHSGHVDYLKKSLSIKPNNASAHSNLGNALKNLNRYDEALESFDKAIEINSNFADAYSNRGVILQEIKHFDEALKKSLDDRDWQVRQIAEDLLDANRVITHVDIGPRPN